PGSPRCLLVAQTRDALAEDQPRQHRDGQHDQQEGHGSGQEPAPQPQERRVDEVLQHQGGGVQRKSTAPHQLAVLAEEAPHLERQVLVTDIKAVHQSVQSDQPSLARHAIFLREPVVGGSSYPDSPFRSAPSDRRSAASISSRPGPAAAGPDAWFSTSSECRVARLAWSATTTTKPGAARPTTRVTHWGGAIITLPNHRRQGLPNDGHQALPPTPSASAQPGRRS